MTKLKRPPEASMDEILASIRRIITETPADEAAAGPIPHQDERVQGGRSDSHSHRASGNGHAGNDRVSNGYDREDNYSDERGGYQAEADYGGNGRMSGNEVAYGNGHYENVSRDGGDDYGREPGHEFSGNSQRRAPAAGQDDEFADDVARLLGDEDDQAVSANAGEAYAGEDYASEDYVVDLGDGGFQEPAPVPRMEPQMASPQQPVRRAAYRDILAQPLVGDDGERVNGQYPAPLAPRPMPTQNPQNEVVHSEPLPQQRRPAPLQELRPNSEAAFNRAEPASPQLERRGDRPRPITPLTGEPQPRRDYRAELAAQRQPDPRQQPLSEPVDQRPAPPHGRPADSAASAQPGALQVGASQSGLSQSGLSQSGLSQSGLHRLPDPRPATGPLSGQPFELLPSGPETGADDAAPLDLAHQAAPSALRGAVQDANDAHGGGGNDEAEDGVNDVFDLGPATTAAAPVALTSDAANGTMKAAGYAPGAELLDDEPLSLSEPLRDGSDAGKALSNEAPIRPGFIPSAAVAPAAAAAMEMPSASPVPPVAPSGSTGSQATAAEPVSTGTATPQAIAGAPASAAADSATADLAASVAAAGNGPLRGRDLEDMVADMLKPMLRQWLDDNMPRMIERVLAEQERDR